MNFRSSARSSLVMLPAKGPIRKYFEVAWFMWRRAISFILDVAYGCFPAYFVVSALHNGIHLSTIWIVLSFVAVVTSLNVFFCFVPLTRSCFLRMCGMQLVTDNGQAVPLKMQILRLCIRNFLFPLIFIEFFLAEGNFCMTGQRSPLL